MVKSLEISDMCLESYPCQHHCKIALLDGREVNVTLGGPSVGALIQGVESQKIKSSWAADHFSYPTFSKNEAGEILKSFFKV